MKIGNVNLFENLILVGSNSKSKLYAVGKTKEEDSLVVTISVNEKPEINENTQLATIGELIKFSQPDEWNFNKELDKLI